MDTIAQRIERMQQELTELAREVSGHSSEAGSPRRPSVPAFEQDLDMKLERQGSNVILRNTSGMELARFPAMGFQAETGIDIPDGGSTEIELEVSGGDTFAGRL